MNPDDEELKTLTRDELIEACLQMRDSRDRVFSIVSHDLRSPYSGLLGLSDLLAGSSADLSRAELDEYLSTMNEALRNSYRLLENLFEWGQIERDKFDRTIETIPLGMIMIDILEPLEQQISAKQIELVQDFEYEQTVHTNSRMIEFVVKNLISNAVKYSKRGGVVRVGYRLVDGKPAVYVEDEGIGISKDNIARLFSITSNWKIHGTENENGTGLGLLASYRYAEEFGAEIRVESIQGKGSTFIIVLPEAGT